MSRAIAITNKQETDGTLTFSLNNTPTCFSNALRRTIISDIKTVVFITFPHEKNKMDITVNTTRFNNEILKQRLSCIPIHITDISRDISDYIVEVDVKNTTNDIIMVTTEHFKIKNKTSGEYLSESEQHIIFPPFVPNKSMFSNEKYFIEFARLRPKISDEIQGEELCFTAEMDIGTSRENGMYNVTGTCSYGMTPDADKIEMTKPLKIQEFTDKNMTESEIVFETKNWLLLDALRLTVPNSVDFTIKSVGVFENSVIVKKACDVIVGKFNALNNIIQQSELKVIESNNTMENSFDIILQNEDYTIGHILDYLMYMIFLEDKKILTYCAFKKLHPHDSHSIIRVAYDNNINDVIDSVYIYQNLLVCTNIAIDIFNSIHNTI